MNNQSNITFVFLFFILCKGTVAGLATFMLYVGLLVIYTLWYVKHKSDFIKNIDKGYALTAVGINFAVIFAIIFSLHSLGGHPY